MSNKDYEKFKKTGSIEDYLNYIKNKKQAVEVSREIDSFGVKRRDCSKNN